MAATIALTLLTLAGVASFGRLFSTGGWVGPVVITVIGMHAVAWICRRQQWPAAGSAVVLAAALLLLVSWLVLPGSTRFGLPLTATWRAAGQALRDGRGQFHAVTAPAPAIHGFVFITTAAVGLLVVLADWAAFRMRATIEATVPALTLFVFTAWLGGHAHRSGYIAAELAALVGFIVVHQSTVVRDRSAWFANRTDGALSSAVRTGAVIGLAAIVVCLNLSFRLPGARSAAVLKSRASDRLGGSGTREAPNPLVDLQSHLLNHSGADVFTVSASTPTYWRLTSLDTYAGTEWMSNDTYAPVRRTLPTSGASIDGTRVEQDFTIANLDSPWLPAAYQPESITGPTGISYDPQSGSLITSKASSTGLKYHVTSVLNVGQLTPTVLRSAPPLNAADHSLARYTKLPKIPADVSSLARAVTSGKTTEYDKALALQDYLRSATFTYDDTYDSKGDGPGALEYFLFTSKRGYCQQFAGSFAVMARDLGLPTRLALGWTYGTKVNGVWHVSDNNYHTWPEVYFPQVGWVPFEPTPGRGIPGAQPYTNVPTAQEGSTPGQATTASPATAPDLAAAAAAAAGKRGVNDPGGTSATSSKATGHSHGSWAVLWTTLAVVLALAVAGAAWLGGVACLRRIRWKQRRLAALGAPAKPGRTPAGPGGSDGSGAPKPGAAGRQARRALAKLGGRWLRAAPLPVDLDEPEAAIVARAEVLLSWAETAELLAWWKLRRQPAETYTELARRAAAQLRLPLSFDQGAAASLIRLASAATKAEYGGGLSTTEAELAVEAAASIGRSLKGSATAWQRFRLALDPRLSAGRV